MVKADDTQNVVVPKTAAADSMPGNNGARTGAATTGNVPASHADTVGEEHHPPAHCEEAQATFRAEPDLRRLERYRRRATSCCKRAIREFQRQAEGIHGSA